MVSAYHPVALLLFTLLYGRHVRSNTSEAPPPTTTQAVPFFCNVSFVNTSVVQGEQVQVQWNFRINYPSFILRLVHGHNETGALEDISPGDRSSGMAIFDSSTLEPDKYTAYVMGGIDFIYNYTLTPLTVLATSSQLNNNTSSSNSGQSGGDGDTTGAKNTTTTSDGGHGSSPTVSGNGITTTNPPLTSGATGSGAMNTQTPSNTPESIPTSSSSTTYPPGVIAGIVIGALVGLALWICVCIVAIKRRKRTTGRRAAWPAMRQFLQSSSTAERPQPDKIQSPTAETLNTSQSPLDEKAQLASRVEQDCETPTVPEDAPTPTQVHELVATNQRQLEELQWWRSLFPALSHERPGDSLEVGPPPSYSGRMGSFASAHT